jgi:hypothetical protein
LIVAIADRPPLPDVVLSNRGIEALAMNHSQSAESTIRRTALVVAYAVFFCGTAAVFAQRDFWLLRRFIDDFPGPRSLTMIAVYVAIALLIPKAVTALASRLTSVRK